MRIFVIGSNVPSETHGRPGVTAVNIVLHELLVALIGCGHEVCLQILCNVWRNTPLDAVDFQELERLRARGLTALDPIYADEYHLPTPSHKGRPLRLLQYALHLIFPPKLSDFYPAVRIGDKVCDRVMAWKTDVILTVWSPEGVAATHRCVKIPKVDYHGAVDFVPLEVRLRYRALFSDGDCNNTCPKGGKLRAYLRDLASRRRLAQFKRVHFALMSGVDSIATVSACDVETYRLHGHPRAVYVPNTWRRWRDDELGNDGERMVSHTELRDHPFKLIGHIGYLDRTGSTFGLRYLLVDVLPQMEHEMRGLDYELHIIGDGQLAGSLRPYVCHSRVIMRGYMADLDGELATSDVFLLLNNAGPICSAYTRHMMAWSMGLCLIVHANSVKAIPEITHMENALVGSTPVEIARMIHLAVTDRDLNRRVRQGGRSTYERYFAPSRVAEALSQEIELAVGRR